MGRPQVLVIAGVLVGLVAVALLLGFAEDDPPEDASPVIVCIDSTVSTDEVRASYLPDLEAVARQAAVRQAVFYAAACGANATGRVNWPVHERFTSNYSNSDLAREQARNQAKHVIEGSDDSVGIEDLIATSSTREGTPLGEMLAVAARQCGQAGGDCSIYVFTDGEWADRLLKVSDGVTEAERQRYLTTYAPQIADLSGSLVNFVGVGFGTVMGELRLSEAEAVAAELIRAAGGEMGAWVTRM